VHELRLNQWLQLTTQRNLEGTRRGDTLSAPWSRFLRRMG